MWKDRSILPSTSFIVTVGKTKYMCTDSSRIPWSKIAQRLFVLFAQNLFVSVKCVYVLQINRYMHI